MRKIKYGIILVLVAGAAAFLLARNGRSSASDEVTREVHPSVGKVETVISSTGTVLPKNRLEIKPPVAGRVDKVLVQEGEKVKAGQLLALMSSTDRAALMDAARGKGEETLKYWEEVYKPIQLLSPINGQVIVATTQPGQTVTTSDAVLVLSDHLIVRAQVDETDIGKISLGQEATLTLDAYPDVKIQATVEHIYYESQTVNNVTIYPVDLLPRTVPPFFRSGMNATVDFLQQSKANALLLPVDAVQKNRNGDGSFVWVMPPKGGKPVRTPVKTGITDDKNIEIVAGVTPEDTVLIKTKKFVLPEAGGGTNPFMPSRHRRR